MDDPNRQMGRKTGWRKGAMRTLTTTVGWREFWQQGEWSEKCGEYFWAAIIATVPKPFFLKKKRQFYDHKEATFFFYWQLDHYIHSVLNKSQWYKLVSIKLLLWGLVCLVTGTQQIRHTSRNSATSINKTRFQKSPGRLIKHLICQSQETQ